MNNIKSKYFETANIFDEALINLLNEKDINYITVKEICKKAGFNRSTFYLHYETINDLLKETLEYVNKKMINYFNEEPAEIIGSLNNYSKEDLMFINEKYLIPYLNYVKENKQVFGAATLNPQVMQTKERYNSLEKYLFNPILARYGIDDKKKKYIIHFYLKGVMAIIEEWLKNDCNDSVDFIVSIILECVRP